MKTTIYVYLFDTLADWEIGYVTAGINNPMMQTEPGKYHLKTFSINGKPVRTLGGLHVVPDLGLDEVSPGNAAMLILPGGTSWDAGDNTEVLPLAKDFLDAGIPVAAICGATMGLAKAGILDSVAHTSNSKDYILMSKYQGGASYRDAAVVRDKGVITASGMAPLEFAREIFEELGLYAKDVLAAWYKLCTTRSPEAFAELMAAAKIQ